MKLSSDVLVISGAADWDPEAVEYLRERLHVLSVRCGQPHRRMDVKLQHVDGRFFSATANVEIRNIQVHAHAKDSNPFVAAHELEQHLWQIFEHDRHRRWAARYSHGLQHNRWRNSGR